MSPGALFGLSCMTPTTAFTGLSTVAIPVTDQDRTKSLLESLGFETRFDADLGDGFRWIELAPPGAATSIALVASGDDLPTGVDTGIRLVTPMRAPPTRSCSSSTCPWASCSTGRGSRSCSASAISTATASTSPKRRERQPIDL